MERHEHYDHYEDLEKCKLCGGTDLTFDPKLGNECGTCGYKEWQRLEDQNCGVRSIPGESCPDCGHFMGYVRILGFGHRCKRCGHEDYETDD